MRLSELLKEERIAIQCHDNPDADALASGLGLFCFFENAGIRELKFFYGGSPVAKPNLFHMIEELCIPIENEPDMREWDGLLITVDCQYGAGNVMRVEAPKIAVIDHHVQECELPALCDLRPWLGSCSTLIWHLLTGEGFPIDVRLGTALHYGLFSDTNGFSEIRHPLDRDMWDSVPVDERILKKLKRSNLSLSDLRVASAALSNLYLDTAYSFVIISIPPCDPNLLGFVTDMSIQVDGVDIAIASSESLEGIKFSVRTTTRETKASELAAWLSRDTGSGGGHRERAGGYIARTKYLERFGGLPASTYFVEALREYLGSCKIIDCSGLDEKDVKNRRSAAKISMTSMRTFRKLPVKLGFVPCHMLFEGQADLQVRMLEGDMDISVDENTILMIGIKGEVYPIELETFTRRYTTTDERFAPDLPYNPTVLNKNAGTRISLLEFAHTCVGSDESRVSAMRLENRVKIFTRWDAENYFRGDPGDWLVARSPDDLYIIAADVFDKLYIRDCTGEDISARKDAVPVVRKNIPASALQIGDPFIVEPGDGRGILRGERGDWLVQHGPGEYEIVGREIFRTTFDIVEGGKKEGKANAG
ncbi:MAG: DHH family phosphoesterase [Synergistaceae bacterium]|nr:DHH family phosphoesterase [Synergistaceae bacterium]